MCLFHRELGGIPVIVRLLRHSEWRVRYAAICLLRNLSFSMRHDANRVRQSLFFVPFKIPINMP